MTNMTPTTPSVHPPRSHHDDGYYGDDAFAAWGYSSYVPSDNGGYGHKIH